MEGRESVGEKLIKIDNIMRDININKTNRDPSSRDAHEQLVEEFGELVDRAIELCEKGAFGIEGIVDIDNPTETLRDAIRKNDDFLIRCSAFSAYKNEQYSVVRLASEFNDDIAILIDVLEMYGCLSSLNQKMFMKAMLEWVNQK